MLRSVPTLKVTVRRKLPSPVLWLLIKSMFSTPLICSSIGVATVSDTVATPIEEQINGVENMLFMSSQSTGDGSLRLTVTFKVGTDLNIAQVLVQNRVAIALPRLPPEV